MERIEHRVIERAEDRHVIAVTNYDREFVTVYEANRVSPGVWQYRSLALSFEALRPVGDALLDDRPATQIEWDAMPLALRAVMLMMQHERRGQSGVGYIINQEPQQWFAQIVPRKLL